MEFYLNIFSLVILVFVWSFNFYALLVSRAEKETIAVKKLLQIQIVLTILLPLFYFLGNIYIYSIFLILTIIPTAVLLLPLSGAILSYNTPSRILDERDVMFSRSKMKEGTHVFTEYYQNNPDKKELDDKFRKAPGLLKEGASYYNNAQFTSAKATFNAVDQLANMVNGEVNKIKIDYNTDEISAYLKGWALKLGAHSAGITELKPYHLYTHKGRGERYGREIINNHKYAIVFTTEMDREMVEHSPFGPIVMESSRQYLNSGAIAVQVAEFIRMSGFEATAHIDANYEVVCPLVARDAGLGEIGRMGLLMTPEIGPRVRISVVTTDLPLNIDVNKPDTTIINFCDECKKCARACPSMAIPFDERKEIDGVNRWQIDSEACFTYWYKVGTDCGRCMQVCPYSHPDNFLHNFVRYGIKNNKYFRSLAVVLDNYLYGKNPRPIKPANWMKIS